ncbi:MAG TPA: arginine decarboxylase [Clostridiales bacterium]|jgi:arginine/lysine/ornithine decarboxylase|nr:arginine decarboxylase [Clostridiales bacterium]
MKNTAEYINKNIIIYEDKENIQNKTPLANAMIDYRNKNCTPFDVPGHKYGRGVGELVEFYGERTVSIDFNSMKSLDILSDPTSTIKEAEDLLAKAYHADNGYFVVNGTSSAVKAMIMSVCKPGDKIIIPRNAHKSSLSAMILSGAVPVYIQPEYDFEYGVFQGVEFEEVKRIIDKNKDAKAILIINPTYYGAVSDLKKIADYAHKYNIAVLVDEAHGAHFNFHDELPLSSMDAGADIAAVSTHKTGGSLTQSSVVISQGNIVNPKIIRKYLNLNGTTSSSYLLMASIDIARKNLALNGKKIFDSVLHLSRYGRDEINKIYGFKAFGTEIIGKPGVFNFDETKLVVNSCNLGITGFELSDILRDEYNIQVELGDSYNILAVVSLGDDFNSINILIEALKDISIKYRSSIKKVNHLKNIGELEVAMTPRDAFYGDTEKILFKDSIGRISGESIMAYPPGIPIVTPGEVITKEVIEYTHYLRENNALITDIEDKSLNTIKVIK